MGPLESLKPTTQTPISVPYISPHVLRRELETVLDKEGDSCLTTPRLPELHPIIYWNLIYFFHRIAVPSHLPGLLPHVLELDLFLPSHRRPLPPARPPAPC